MKIVSGYEVLHFHYDRGTRRLSSNEIDVANDGPITVEQAVDDHCYADRWPGHVGVTIQDSRRTGTLRAVVLMESVKDQENK
jgi:hypothetical protein